MANFVSHIQFDIFEIDLNFYSSNYYDSLLQKNLNIQINEITYPDYYWVNGYDGVNDFQLDFFGTGITENALGQITGGTVNFIGERQYQGSVFWFIEGILISATSVYNAALTISNSDELALVATALNGSDNLVLSPFDDRMNAYGGDDHVRGRGGNDIIDGGPGTDTAYFLDPIENATIAFAGGELVVTTPNEGTDRLTNFEFVQFAGEARSVSSLTDLIAPTVTSFLPADGATGVARSANITATFSEAIQRGNGSIFLRVDSPTGTIVEQFDAGTSTKIIVSNSTLTIDPTVELGRGTHYFVTFDNGAIRDLVGNKFAGTSTYDFTTLSLNQPPTATSATINAIEDGSLVSGQLQASDPDSDPLAFSPILTGLFAPGVAGLSIFADGRYSFDPTHAAYQSLAAGETVELIGGYFVSDGALTASSTLTITITGVNDAPSFAQTTQTLAAVTNITKPFTVSAVDVDGDALSYAAEDTAHGSLSGGAGGNFAYTPDAGFLGTDSISVLVSDSHGGTAALGVVVFVSPPPATGFRYFVSSGVAAEIGGSGNVFGTNGFQDITIVDLPGSLTLDASFNRGGDIIRLTGGAATWDVVQSGSNAILSDGDTFLTIPVGSSGIVVLFDDGVRTLRFDAGTGSVKIGTQSFGATQAQISAPTDGTNLPSGENLDASSRLFLSAEASATVGGKVTVFGTTGAERVTVTFGDATLDASFNRGGDVVILDKPATSFLASMRGSNLFLDSGTLDLTIPVGTSGTSLVFGADERTLAYDTVQATVLIAAQGIGGTPVALTEFA